MRSGWPQSSFLTPLKGVNKAAYANDALKKQGEILDNRLDLPLRRFRPDARQDRRRRLLDRHDRPVGGKSAQDTAKEIQSAWDGIK
jgi:alpha-glucoside transport system substrate-binding protein